MKKLLLIMPAFLLGGCLNNEAFEIRRKANLEAAKQCVAAGGLPKLDENGHLHLCDFSLKDQLSTRPAPCKQTSPNTWTCESGQAEKPEAPK